jgi:hypothetical protein
MADIAARSRRKFSRAWAYAPEIKAPCGRATAAQLEALAEMEAAGAFTCVAEGLDRALAVLEQWRLLRGAVT